jgi:hypothetical protein
MADPKFVRLADHMVHGLLVDMETGWKISGYDVKEFPEDSEQARYVKRNIQQGKLEPAGQAEFDELHPEEEPDEAAAEAQKFAAAVTAASAKKNAGVQEHEIQQKVAERQAAVRKARAQAKREERNENARSSRGGRRVRPAAAEEESEA